jgi:hypothetical protein
MAMFQSRVGDDDRPCAKGVAARHLLARALQPVHVANAQLPRSMITSWS